MSEEDKPKRDYEVGFCKPPKSGQFKKGQSGNPDGLRKRTLRVNDQRQLDRDVLNLLNKRQKVKINGKIERLSGHELILRAQLQKAAQGDRFAYRMLEKRGTEAARNMNMANPALARELQRAQNNLVDPDTTSAELRPNGIGSMNFQYIAGRWNRM